LALPSVICAVSREAETGNAGEQIKE